ncbi:hypothetical protein LXA43DRAFT_1007472 [Ganoderma leucocontextum]|nr:hypothetical protein LXA43DRAFT_1007472 [Ganoderma leucocontextum]
MAATTESQPAHPEPCPEPPLPLALALSSENSTVDPTLTSSLSSSSAPDAQESSELPKLRLREFIWGENIIRSVLPRTVIPPWLDPLDVDVDDPTELPLCWYGVPFCPELVFPYSRRIGVAVYMTHRNLKLKPGDFDAYGTWPRLVEWFEKRSGLTMHVKSVWGHSTPILTFWTNHEMASTTREKWVQVCDFLDAMEYPLESELKWYLDRRLKF